VEDLSTNFDFTNQLMEKTLNKVDDLLKSKTGKIFSMLLIFSIIIFIVIFIIVKIS
jgi:hypothetical protein